MKKILAITVALVLVLSIGAIALADGRGGQQERVDWAKKYAGPHNQGAVQSEIVELIQTYDQFAGYSASQIMGLAQIGNTANVQVNIFATNK